MRNLPNIDPSAFHKGEYVGYGDGVWRIKPAHHQGWLATPQDSAPVCGAFWSQTLEDVSAKLITLAAMADARFEAAHPGRRHQGS